MTVPNHLQRKKSRARDGGIGCIVREKAAHALAFSPAVSEKDRKAISHSFHSISQSRAMPSAEPVTSLEPSGLKTRCITPSPCP